MIGEAGKHKHRIVVGLGNPGTEYDRTRHNMGRNIVQQFAKECGWMFKRDSKLSAEAARGIFEEVDIHLVLATTYMNETGRAIRRYLDYFRLGIDELIVVADDVALPFGTLRLRMQGSSGGHNGLKSIEENIGSQNYVRLRIGVGQPSLGEDLADYVLERFTVEEASQLPQVLEKSVQAVKYTIVHSIEHAMNLLNIKGSGAI